MRKRERASESEKTIHTQTQHCNQKSPIHTLLNHARERERDTHTHTSQKQFIPYFSATRKQVEIKKQSKQNESEKERERECEKRSVVFRFLLLICVKSKQTEQARSFSVLSRVCEREKESETGRVARARIEASVERARVPCFESDPRIWFSRNRNPRLRKK